MSHDRPTPAERAADLTHDPKTCHVYMNPNRYGEQAPDPEELAHARDVDALRAECDQTQAACEETAELYREALDEAEALRAQVATLTAERDSLKEAHAKRHDELTDAWAEIDALEDDVATLSNARDYWKASHASVNATLDAVAVSVARTVEAEREVCAKVAERFQADDGAELRVAEDIAAAIRARSKP